MIIKVFKALNTEISTAPALATPPTSTAACSLGRRTPVIHPKILCVTLPSSTIPATYLRAKILRGPRPCVSRTLPRPKSHPGEAAWGGNAGDKIAGATCVFLPTV